MPTEYQPKPPGWLVFTGDDWRTPIDWLVHVFNVFEVVHDPCAAADPDHQYAEHNTTEGGIDITWDLGPVFFNNPYSNSAGWVLHAAKQKTVPRIGLFPPAVGTNFWHQGIFPNREIGKPREEQAASAICYVKGRIPFLHPKDMIPIAKGQWAYEPGVEWVPGTSNRYESSLVLWDAVDGYPSFAPRFHGVFSHVGYVQLL